MGGVPTLGMQSLILLTVTDVAFVLVHAHCFCRLSNAKQHG